MSINVLASTIVIASISYAQPGFEAQYVQPVAQASYVEAAAQTNYLEVQVTVELFISDLVKVDVVTPTDLINLNVNKGFTDNFGPFFDTFLKVLNKQPAELVNTTDSITTFSVLKALQDVQNVAEEQKITFIKALLDTVSFEELTSFASVKAISDLISTPTEEVSRNLVKALSDSTSLTDAVALFIDQVTADDVTLADASNLSQGVDPPAENTNLADILSYSVGKDLSEEINISESIAFQLQKSIILSFAEILYKVDEHTFDFATQKADNMVIGSSGLLIMQDYCDITYFLEDYVGESRTFT